MNRSPTTAAEVQRIRSIAVLGFEDQSFSSWFFLFFFVFCFLVWSVLFLAQAFDDSIEKMNVVHPMILVTRSINGIPSHRDLMQKFFLLFLRVDVVSCDVCRV